MPVGGLFGDTPPAACEFCGGGGCLPPTWSFNTSVAVMAMSRAANQTLGTNSLPGGPFFAGSVTSGTTNGNTISQTYYQYLNDVPNGYEGIRISSASALEIHTPVIVVSPMVGLELDRFLGRDGEGRDHFLDFAFNGLERYSATATAVGSIIPVYDTTPFLQTLPEPPPTVTSFNGSLISPFPFYQAVNGHQPSLTAPTFSILGENYDRAFNRSDFMSTSYTSTYNEFEVDYRIAGHNQPDQLVMNPNGRWYRQCQSGYYYSYFFGPKMMIINEKFSFLSSGSEYGVIDNGDGTFSQGPLLSMHQGQYDVNTFNTMLGLHTGGKLEYRFCRWCLDIHGDAGMFLNFARQDSRIRTDFTGNPAPLSDGSTPVATDNSFMLRRIPLLSPAGSAWREATNSSQPRRTRGLRLKLDRRYRAGPGTDGLFGSPRERPRDHQCQGLRILRRRHVRSGMGLVAPRPPADTEHSFRN